MKDFSIPEGRRQKRKNKQKAGSDLPNKRKPENQNSKKVDS